MIALRDLTIPDGLIKKKILPHNPPYVKTSGSRSMFGKRDKGFSSKNKVQQYHGDGTETIIVMGKPFRVLQKLSDAAPAHTGGQRRRVKNLDSDHMSYVFLVENSSRMTEFPRHVALKRSSHPVDQVQEAHKEIEVMSRIKDKNIVRVFHSEISRSDGKLGVSIAMEYCGNNLFRRIRSGASGGAGTRLSESEICHVLLSLTSALGYLHSQQPPIAHRDIRPENILINNNSTGPAAYKLCNFSSSTTEAYQCETREEASMAIADIEFHTNPGFRSPEMADPWSKRRICERSDMWSLGVLLYYMMYLRLPFEATNMALSNNPKVKFPASESGRYCGSLRLITEKLLDANPDSRWDVFALTNFLRFDEDVSRHLGTFCFTRTEYPEGWEEQDVKVIGRDQPAKPAPVTYGGEMGHISVEDDRKAAAERRLAVAAGEGGHESANHRNNNTNSPATTTNANRGSNGNAINASDDGVREAMLVLGGEDDDDPEMAQYRLMVIQEQEEMLARIKAQSGRSDTTGGGGGNSNHDAATSAAAAPELPKKKDLFDDLFAGPAQPPAPVAPPPFQQQQQQPGQAASTAPPAQQQQQPQPQKDVFSADDLFSGPPMQQQQQPQAQGWGGAAGGGFGGGWDTGAPAGVTSPPAQQQQQQHWDSNNYGGGGYQPQQQQGGWGTGGGFDANANANNTGYGVSHNNAATTGGFYPGPQHHQQQQQPQQASMNLIAPATTGPQQQQPIPVAAVSLTKKDPFADLFS